MIKLIIIITIITIIALGISNKIIYEIFIEICEKLILNE